MMMMVVQTNLCYYTEISKLKGENFSHAGDKLREA